MDGLSRLPHAPRRNARADSTTHLGAIQTRLPAVRPGNLAVDPGLPYGQTVRQFLDQLKKRPPHLQRKWRSDILLLTFPAWFNEEETKVPWTLVKSLRQAEAPSDGWLSLRELAAAAAQLNVPQHKTDGAGAPSVSGNQTTQSLSGSWSRRR